MTSNPRPHTLGHDLGRRHTTVVREHRPAYNAGDRRQPSTRRVDDGRHQPHLDRADGAGGGADQGPPLGVPVLAEVPELADPLEAYVQADRLMVRMVLDLAELLETEQDVAVQTTGVGVEHWLALTGSAPRLERRTWLRAARLLLRLPQLRDCVDAGLVSAGQLRALTINLRGVPTVIDGRLDGWLADAATELHRLGADPDAIVEQARHALVELTDHTDVVETEANRTRQLHLQPRLDGSGGTFHGEEDAYGFAILEAATRPRPHQSDLDTGHARADNLQTLLHHIDPTPCGGGTQEACGNTCGADDACGCARRTDDVDPGTVDVDSADRDGDGPVVHRSWAHAIADAEQADAAHLEQLTDLPGLAERIAGYADAGGLTPPKLLLRAELSTLLEDGRIPATLLTALAGGQLRMTSTAARALIEAHGADLRLTIIDHGRVVGVGRANRRPPGWLSDTLHAIHDHCTGPLCYRPAHRADIDHAATWQPHGDQPAGGRTDLDNLGPLCAHPNRNRPATGWRPSQRDTTGIRTWTHSRAGLRTTSVPATWRPPSRHHGTGPPGGTGPPDDPASDTPPEPEDLPF